MWFLLIILVLAMMCDSLGRAILLTIVTPIIDIIVCITFIILLIVLAVCEMAMMVIAPIALLCGRDSREWHVTLTHKIMFLKDIRNEAR